MTFPAPTAMAQKNSGWATATPLLASFCQLWGFERSRGKVTAWRQQIKGSADNSTQLCKYLGDQVLRQVNSCTQKLALAPWFFALFFDTINSGLAL